MKNRLVAAICVAGLVLNPSVMAVTNSKSKTAAKKPPNKKVAVKKTKVTKVVVKKSQSNKPSTKKLIAKIPAKSTVVNPMPSPDWRDQVIYFLMTDRFCDGDKSNDNQGVGEYGSGLDQYNGGDLKGVADKIDYLKELGATAIWITPPVANQWLGGHYGDYYGFHGYWASNFKEVDKHLGTLNTYKAMVKKFHDNKMYVIQDIVCNHTGDYFTYDPKTYDANDVTKGWTATKSLPTSAPTQPPFNENNPNNKKDLKDAIYHFTPSIQDFANEDQMHNWEDSDLDDLNTENPVVVNALMDSYRYWIKAVGVDAYRIDTAKYVPNAFYKTFINSTDSKNLGVKNYAKQLGKNNFFTFGEIYNEKIDDNKFIGSYTKDSSGSPLIDSALNFPLEGTLKSVFKGGKPTSDFTKEITEMNKDNYQHPEELVNFIDNHDMDRWLNDGTIANMKQALAVIMTVPGVPCIYYGTEQGFTERRAAMFKEGYASGGTDHYDTTSEMYKFIQKLTSVRKANAVLRRGTIKVLKDDSKGTGILAYKMTYNGQNAIMIYNTSSSTKVINNIKTDIADNTNMKAAMSSDDNQKDVVIGKGGTFSTEAAPSSFTIFIQGKTDANKASNIGVTLDNFDSKTPLVQDATLTGTAQNAQKVYAIIDGNVDKAFSGDIADGKWSIKLDLSKLRVGSHTLALKAVDQNGNYIMTDDYAFESQKSAGGSLLATASEDDPVGDDKGPKGTYSYPTDKTFTKQLDMTNVKAEDTGDGLKLTFKMSDVTDTWTPKNMFDHVCLNIFLQDPKKQGATVIPKQNASVPTGFNWSYEAFVAGWDNKLYSSDGATSSTNGTPITSAPAIAVDKANKTITVTISKEGIGNPDSLNGWKIYVATWDYDGQTSSYRPLNANGADYKFGGGSGDKDPLIMDDITPLELKADTSTSSSSNVSDSPASVEVKDPAGDDKGPKGTYLYPTDKTFTKQLDITNVKAEDTGDSMQITLNMSDLTDTWTPPNKFDHVCFNIFLQDPKKQGETVMPKQNASVPTGFNWSYEVFIAGWNSKLYSSDGATKDKYGASITSAPAISVDKASKTITLTISKEGIGNPDSLKDWGIYISTWDYDGEASSLRALSEKGGDYAFGGGSGDKDPLVMDDIKPLYLK